MEAPETRYAQRPDGVNIAYQVFGGGPRQILYIPGFISHLDLHWTEPRFAAFLRRLAGIAEVIMFDKPGTGLSDPIDYIPTCEERADDVALVLDAAGARRATVVAFSEGVSAAVMFAATRPERVDRLVLYGGLVKGEPVDDEVAAFGITRAEVDDKWAQLQRAVADWGRGRTIEVLCPSVQNPLERRFWALFERAAASPKMAQGLIEAARRLDVVPLLESVRAPTLIVHVVDDFAPIANSRLMAGLIPDARLIELPGRDHAFWMVDLEPVMGEIEEFLTGARAIAEPDRVLATVLFTDVVGSTGRAAELGDARWRAELERLDALVRREVDAAGGRVVKAMGDGHLAAFEGPARAIRCAESLLAQSELPLRAGLHTGECEAMGDDVGGLAVHIGARVGSLAATGEVLVSSTVKELVVGAGFSFSDRGEHSLKGVPGTWRLFAVGSGEAPAPVETARVLRRGDRLALRMANRAPGRMRSAARLALKLRS